MLWSARQRATACTSLRTIDQFHFQFIFVPHRSDITFIAVRRVAHGIGSLQHFPYWGGNLFGGDFIIGIIERALQYMFSDIHHPVTWNGGVASEINPSPQNENQIINRRDEINFGETGAIIR